MSSLRSRAETLIPAAFPPDALWDPNNAVPSLVLAGWACPLTPQQELPIRYSQSLASFLTLWPPPTSLLPIILTQFSKLGPLPPPEPRASLEAPQGPIW